MNVELASAHSFLGVVRRRSMAQQFIHHATPKEKRVGSLRRLGSSIRSGLSKSSRVSVGEAKGSSRELAGASDGGRDIEAGRELQRPHRLGSLGGGAPGVLMAGGGGALLRPALLSPRRGDLLGGSSLGGGSVISGPREHTVAGSWGNAPTEPQGTSASNGARAFAAASGEGGNTPQTPLVVIHGSTGHESTSLVQVLPLLPQLFNRLDEVSRRLDAVSSVLPLFESRNSGHDSVEVFNSVKAPVASLPLPVVPRALTTLSYSEDPELPLE